MVRAFLFSIVMSLSFSALSAVQPVTGLLAGGKAYVKITGPIDEETSKAFFELMAQFPEVREIELHLNSGGGKSLEGWKIIALLNEKKSAGVHLTTLVKNGNICGSLCVPIFVQGQTRKAGPASSFMFHSAHLSFAGMVTVKTLPERNEEMFQYFLKAGVSPKWLDHLKAQQVFESDEYYWLSGGDLLSEKSGVVTELLPRKDETLKLFGLKTPF